VVSQDDQGLCCGKAGQAKKPDPPAEKVDLDLKKCATQCASRSDDKLDELPFYHPRPTHRMRLPARAQESAAATCRAPPQGRQSPASTALRLSDAVLKARAKAARSHTMAFVRTSRRWCATRDRQAHRAIVPDEARTSAWRDVPPARHLLPPRARSRAVTRTRCVLPRDKQADPRGGINELAPFPRGSRGDLVQPPTK